MNNVVGVKGWGFFIWGVLVVGTWVTALG